MPTGLQVSDDPRPAGGPPRGAAVPDDGTVVVVGASLTAATIAGALREDGFPGRIVLVGAEPDLPYERPGLSKGYLLGTDPRDSVFVHPADWYAEQRVELRLGTRVTAIDRSEHRVQLEGPGGGEQIPYDRLVLATGSRPRRLDVPGSRPGRRRVPADAARRRPARRGVRARPPRGGHRRRVDRPGDRGGGAPGGARGHGARGRGAAARSCARTGGRPRVRRPAPRERRRPAHGCGCRRAGR